MTTKSYQLEGYEIDPSTGHVRPVELIDRLKSASPHLLESVILLQDKCTYKDITTLAYAMRAKAPNRRFPKNDLEMAEMLMEGLRFIEQTNADMVADKMLDRESEDVAKRPF